MPRYKSKVNNLQRANKSDRGDSIQYEMLAVMSRRLLPTAAKRHQPNHVKSAGNTEMSPVNSVVIVLKKCWLKCLIIAAHLFPQEPFSVRQLIIELVQDNVQYKTCTIQSLLQTQAPQNPVSCVCDCVFVAF